LQLANSKQPLKVDRYGSGGAVKNWKKNLKPLPVKKSDLYAKRYHGQSICHCDVKWENTKVFVQDTSHVYRDEADAAQSIFNKRLMPLAKNQTFFTADELKKAIEILTAKKYLKAVLDAFQLKTLFVVQMAAWFQLMK
jgi:threonine aldolase